MSEHTAAIRWRRNNDDFLRGRYSRVHSWHFDGGVTVPASPAPSVIPAPYSDPANVDPEEAFVAAIASCHMLTFLHIASKAGIQIDAYEDNAVGHMTQNEQGAYWISEVILHPTITYGDGSAPSNLAELHEQAHAQCFIANSVKTHVVVA